MNKSIKVLVALILAASSVVIAEGATAGGAANASRASWCC